MERIIHLFWVFMDRCSADMIIITQTRYIYIWHYDVSTFENDYLCGERSHRVMSSSTVRDWALCNTCLGLAKWALNRHAFGKVSRESLKRVPVFVTLPLLTTPRNFIARTLRTWVNPGYETIHTWILLLENYSSNSSWKPRCLSRERGASGRR